MSVCILSLFILLCSVISTPAQDTRHYLFSYFTRNGEDGLHLAYSTDGYNWKALNEGRSFLTPTAGKDKLMRDPSIIHGKDGLFHMVWTVSWGEQGIGYSSSKDLINWLEQQYLPVMEGEGARNCWAPELFYDDATERYFIFWAATIPGEFRKGEEQKYNHRLYYLTTKDFNTFSKFGLLYDHGFSVIDAAIVREGNRYVMFLKDETDAPNTPEKNIRIATSDKAEGPYSAPGEPITGNYWAEGPSPIKINGKWFVYFDKYRQHNYGVVVSPDLENWTDESDKLIMPKGIRHGTVFEVPEQVIRRLLK
jgi:sucrose-6-phosphate hydrolase SacC (GH32 family)